MADNIGREKKRLRKHFTALRKKVSSHDAERFALRIARRVFALPLFLETDLIMVYSSNGHEVDMKILMDLVVSSGRGVVLPYCRADETIGVARVLSPRYDLVKGRFGIMEPAPKFRDNVSPEQLGAVVCPGVAFDEDRYRLGHGGGFYDKFLHSVAKHAFIIGCAYDCQISAAPLPREEHDIPMHAVITETRAFPQNVLPIAASTSGSGTSGAA